MIGLWQYNLNKKIAGEGENIVTLDSILVHINIKDRKFELNSEYSTIRYINKEEYTKDVYSYVEPEFHESYHKSEFSPRFILFSAPGATGKSALAKHICYTKNGIYWDLEYSCAVTPQVRQTGNRLSGLAGTAYASLLA